MYTRKGELEINSLLTPQCPVFIQQFVLTRSFFAGSQRFGAMWTGDNLGTWEHMAVGIKMVLANNIAGFSFSGCECTAVSFSIAQYN